MPIILTKKEAAAALVTFAACLLLNSCISKQNTYGVVSMPVISSDGAYTACIVAESEGISHYENPTYRKTDYSTSYWLKLYETATGKLKEKRKLLDKNAVSPDVECYGVYNNSIWLYANGLKAYEVTTLEEKTNEQKIAKANNITRNTFPYESRMVNADIENGFIDFTADNGEKYRLLLADLKVINKENMLPETKTVTNTHRFFQNDNYGLRCDTLENKMYTLARDDEAAKNASPHITKLNETGYRLKLFTAAYTTRKLGLHNTLETQSFNSLSENTYLNGCFAKETHKDTIIRLSNPVGYLIIHNDVMGEKSQAIITRIDTNGNKIWETVTGVSTKIEHCILSGRYCIISTNKDYMFSPNIGKDALCIINIETHQVIKPKLNL